MDTELLKKYRLTDSKIVADYSWQKEWKAKELISWLQGFLDKNGATDADVAIDIDNWYETSVNGLSITADIAKTEEELLAEIENIKTRETWKRQEAKKRAAECKEQEKQLYNKLHAKYGTPEKTKKKKPR